MMPGHGFLMHSLPPSFGLHSRAVVAQHHRFDAEERSARAAGFQRVDAGQGSDQMAAGLGLPPGIRQSGSGSCR